MFQLIIFLISCYFIYKILGSLIVKLKGEKLGCTSFTVTIFFSIFLSLSISKSLNPNKAEPFFFREEITNKIDGYKSKYKHTNKEYLQKLSENNYYNFSENAAKVNKFNIGCLCRDGKIVSSIEENACSNNNGFYEFITLEIENYIPKKPLYNTTNEIYESTNSGGTVHVRAYTRKDGTYVRSHTRKAPRR